MDELLAKTLLKVPGERMAGATIVFLRGRGRSCLSLIPKGKWTRSKTIGLVERGTLEVSSENNQCPGLFFLDTGCFSKAPVVRLR